jgi:superfamily II DNA/RNA helicase
MKLTLTRAITIMFTNTNQKSRELEAATTTLQKGGVVLIFTSSLDSTHRLCRLLQLYGLLGPPTNPSTTHPNPGGIEKGVGAVHEFSSSLSQPQRAELIRRCLAQGSDVRVLVSSDGMARGIDLPNVAAVVNYDVPTQVGVRWGFCVWRGRGNSTTVCIYVCI